LTFVPIATVRFSVGSLRRPDGSKNLVALDCWSLGKEALDGTTVS